MAHSRRGIKAGRELLLDLRIAKRGRVKHIPFVVGLDEQEVPYFLQTLAFLLRKRRFNHIVINDFDKADIKSISPDHITQLLEFFRQGEIMRVTFDFRKLIQSSIESIYTKLHNKAFGETDLPQFDCLTLTSSDQLYWNNRLALLSEQTVRPKVSSHASFFRNIELNTTSNQEEKTEPYDAASDPILADILADLDKLISTTPKRL